MRITPSANRLNSKPDVTRQPITERPTPNSLSRQPINQKQPAEISRGSTGNRGRDTAASRGGRSPSPSTGISNGSPNTDAITGKGPAQKPSVNRKPTGSGGLQTLESSPIKPAQLSNGSSGTGKGNFKGAFPDDKGGVNKPFVDGKGNFNKPFSSGQFKGPAKGTFAYSHGHGHHGHGHGHGHGHSTFCDDDFNWSISIGFGWGSSIWFGDSWCHPHSYWGHWNHWGHWHNWHCSPHYPVYYYPYYPYYYSYSYYPVYSDPVYYEVQTYVPAPAPYVEKEAPAVSVDAWDLLDQGDAREARRIFAREIDVHPNDGLPQIGYAIASTLIDRKIEAISMMRRAMRNDPEAIFEVPQTQGIMNAVDEALTDYIDMSDRRPDNVDAQFMIAALRYVLGDTSRAFFAIDRAVDWGDTDVSAANLRSIIRRAMEQPAAPPPAPAPAPTGQPVYGPPMDILPVEPPPAEPEKPWDVPF